MEDREKLIEEIKPFCGDVNVEENYIVADIAVTNAGLAEFLEFLKKDSEEHEKF